MDYPLKHSLTFGSTTISRLEFRDYTTANDYLAFDKRGANAQHIALISSMTGNDEALIGKLRGPDYIACVEICDKMLAEDEAESTKVGSAEAPLEKKSLES